MYVRDIFGDMDIQRDPTFGACLHRVRAIARELGLTQEHLWRRVAPVHAIGVEQFKLVMKGRRRPRRWHHFLRAVALALAEEDCRPLPLAAKQRRYLQRIFGDEGGTAAYREQGLGERVAAGGDWVRLTEALIELDYRAIAGLTPEAEGTLAQWTAVHAALHDCGRLLLTADGAIAGYWFYAPLQPEAMRRAKAGRLHDTEIDLDAIVLPGPRALLDVYVVVMALAPEYRGIVARNALVGSFMQHLENLAELGIYLRELCFCAYTAESERLAEGLGLGRGVAHRTYRRLDARDGPRPAHIYEASAAHLAGSTRIAAHWPLLASRYRDLLEANEIGAIAGNAGGRRRAR